MALAVLTLSISIGVSLGLLGGGGSILTVPILTYVAGMTAKAAIASSLFVVGVTSVAGLVTHARAGRVRWRTGLVFGGAGMLGAYVGGQVGSVIPGRILMIAFGVMMAATALAMLRGRRDLAPRRERMRISQVLGNGLAVGAIAGVVGAGGGFLIVPALVLRGGLAMREAIGTSLLVIAMQSFAGVAGHIGHVAIDWPTTLGVTGAAVFGSVIGGRLVGAVQPDALRRGFGLFTVVMAALVLAKELL